MRRHDGVQGAPRMEEQVGVRHMGGEMRHERTETKGGGDATF